MSAKVLVPAIAVLAGLNYVFTELMDESGLHVVFVTGALESARHNTTALAAFRALADLADGMSDPSGTGALRFELTEQRPKQQQEQDDIAPVISATLVHRQRQEAATTLPAWLLANAEFKVHSTQRLRTVFPERARWRMPTFAVEPGALSDVGQLALLVQQQTLVVKAEAADAFRRSWTDLGYNALVEPGVVRCDLLQSDEEPTTFVARKVFRHAAALEAHEASEHYARWQAAVQPALGGAATGGLLDTISPRTSIVPFRSRWE